MFSPQDYYAFSIYDETSLSQSFTDSMCDDCNCGDNKAYEFFDYPKTLLLNKDYDGPILYLTYYSSIIGTLENKTKIAGNINVEPKGTTPGEVCTLGGLDNFWRSLLNVDVMKESWMSVSQACPIRYCNFNKLNLCYGPANNRFTCCPNNSAEYTSGGFMSHCQIQELQICSQQQFLSQDCVFDQEPTGGAWSVVYYNCQNAPASRSFGETPCITTINHDDVSIPAMNIQTPPKLLYSNHSYSLSYENKEIPISTIPCANPGSRPPTKSEMLQSTTGTCLDDFFMNNRDKDILLLPAGIYYITKKLTINSDVIGIGMSSIRILNGGGIIYTKDGGVLYSLLFDNFETTDCVLEILGKNVSCFDLFFRNGGPNTSATITDSALKIKGTNTYLNNLWIWRADHGINGTFVKDSQDCPAKTGMIVESTADHCTAIGLAVEHFDETNVIWKGNQGACVFFQNELPYFVKSFDNKYAMDIQNDFKGFAMGSYCFFRDYPVVVPFAFRIDPNRDISLTNTFTVWLNSDVEGSMIQHVIGPNIGPTSERDTQGVPQFVENYRTSSCMSLVECQKTCKPSVELYQTSQISSFKSQDKDTDNDCSCSSGNHWLFIGGIIVVSILFIILVIFMCKS